MLISKICQGFLGAVKAKLGPKYPPPPLEFVLPCGGLTLPTNHWQVQKQTGRLISKPRNMFVFVRAYTRPRHLFFTSVGVRQPWRIYEHDMIFTPRYVFKAPNTAFCFDCEQSKQISQKKTKLFFNWVKMNSAQVGLRS